MHFEVQVHVHMIRQGIQPNSQEIILQRAVDLPFMPPPGTLLTWQNVVLGQVNNYTISARPVGITMHVVGTVAAEDEAAAVERLQGLGFQSRRIVPPIIVVPRPGDPPPPPPMMPGGQRA